MLKIKYILVILLVFFGLQGYNQTYNPSLHLTTNKSVGIAQAEPVDARTYFYDAVNFTYRPYQNTSEVLTYLNLSKYRVGQFDIVINTGGILNSGVITGGTNAIWYFKNGTANGDLVLKNDVVSVNGQRGVVVIGNADSIRNKVVDFSTVYRNNYLLAIDTAANKIFLTPPASGYTAGTGIDITGQIISALNTQALWNANSVRGRSYSTTPPAIGQSYVWNGIAWSPSSLNGLDTAYIESDTLYLVNTFDTIKVDLSTISSVTASNGLYKDGDTLKLGGALTENTSISGTDKNLFITNTTGVQKYKVGSGSDSSKLQLNIDRIEAQSIDAAGNSSSATITPDNNKVEHTSEFGGTSYLEISNSGIRVDDPINNTGIIYDNDYSDTQIANDNAVPSTLGVKKLISDSLANIPTSRYRLTTTIDSLRLYNVDTLHVYRIVYNKQVADFYYDPADLTTADDSAMTVIAVGGKRLKRYFYDRIYPEWFGAKGDNTTDDSDAFNKMYRWISSNMKNTFTIAHQHTTYFLNDTLFLPKNLPTAGTFLKFKIDGTGVTYTKTNAGPLLYRMPDSQSEALNTMIGAYALSIENLRIKGNSTTGQVGIKIAATYTAIISGCVLETLDTAIVMPFSLNGQITNNFFQLNKSVAFKGCSGENYWTGASTSNSAFNINRFSGNRIFNGNGSYAGALFLAADGTIVDTHISEGFNPRYDFYFDSQASSVVNGNVLKNIWYESIGGINGNKNVCVYLRLVGGTTTFDGFQNDYADTLFQFRNNSGSPIVNVSNIQYYNPTGDIMDAAGLTISGGRLNIMNMDQQFADMFMDSTFWVGGIVGYQCAFSGLGTGGSSGLLFRGSTSNIRLQPNYQAATSSRNVIMDGNLTLTDNTYSIGGVASNLRPSRISVGTNGIRVDKTAAFGFGFGDLTGNPIQYWNQVNDTVTNIQSTGAIRMPRGTSAQRPANFASSFRWNSDTTGFEYNDGSAWNTFAGRPWVRANFGTFTLPSLTSGSVLFSNGSTISQDNSNFFWDATNKRLGLGTNSPSSSYDIHVVRSTAGQAGLLVNNTNSSGFSALNLSAPGGGLLIQSFGSTFPSSLSAQAGGALVAASNILVFDSPLYTFYGGKVGINYGTTLPVYPLDVNGTGRFADTLRLQRTRPGVAVTDSILVKNSTTSAVNAVAANDIGPVVLAKGTVTNAATLDIDMSAYYTTYDYVEIKIISARPVTNADILYMRVSPDAVTYNSTGYKWNLMAVTGASSTNADDAGTGNTSYIQLTGACSNTTAQGVNGTIEIFNPGSSTFYPQVNSKFGRYSNTPAVATSVGTGFLTTAQATRAVRLLFSTGNISTLTYKIIGYKN